jgi:UDP-N-acetylglucosamine--N-acetylmuramyl-(pentapeptide) pyrophosphoryl-undecaprenol N-acetylglucosamine transferase
VNANPLKIVIAGGGTGGHVQPAVAVATKLREMADVDLTWIGSNAGVERGAATVRGIPFYSIPTGKLRRYLSLYTVSDAVRIPFGILRARMLLRSIHPDVVFSTGGFVSVPTVISAWLAGIPIITHEQTATVGLANRINARFADRIALAFEATTAEFPGQRHRLVVTGNPVRPELLGGDGERARRELNLPDDRPVIYVTGGSLGARAINNTVRTLIPELIRASVVIHQCGPSSANGDFPRLLEQRQLLPADLRQRYVVRERLGDELAHVYALADLVVGRGGAGPLGAI